MQANEGFPKTNLQKQAIIGIALDNSSNPQEWAQRLKGPKTGFTLGVTDFGNLKNLGIAITAMPIIELKAFRSEKMKVLTGIGISYLTKKHHPEKNAANRAVTTDFAWAFKMYLNYEVFSSKDIDWRVGVGYSHHSNGHTRMMNNGLNSFLIGVSADFKSSSTIIEKDDSIFEYKNSVFHYLALRSGLGQNVLAIAYNDRKNVYSLSGEYGRVYNNTFKIGVGFYYRFYEHYYNYIQQNESLTQPGREFDYFQNNPWHYATNLGLSLNGEVFLNHFGIEAQLGFNLHKPSYKIDWRINEGWENTPRDIPESWKLGDYNNKFKFKYRISCRLGLKYYFIGMENKPTSNFYVGAHLNANLGQADFTELSLGYVYSFNFRQN